MPLSCFFSLFLIVFMDPFFLLGGQSDRVTEYVVTKTTSSIHPHKDEFDEGEEGENDLKENEEKTKRFSKKRKTTTRATTIVSKIAAHRVTVPISELVENNACTFQGNMPDPENCQCKTTLCQKR